MVDKVANPVKRHILVGVAAVPLGADRIAKCRIAEGDVAAAGDVDGMRPREAGLHLEAVPYVLIQAELQRVVARRRPALVIVDVPKFEFT